MIGDRLPSRIRAQETISEHVKHIIAEDELDPAATVRQFRTVQVEGGREVTRDVELYSLDETVLTFDTQPASAGFVSVAGSL